MIPTAIRPSVGGIFIQDNTIAMVHSLKYHCYKFLGGVLGCFFTAPCALGEIPF